jgi:hypothetical protein
MSEVLTTKSLDVRRAWEQTEKALRKMNRQERVQTLVKSGILTARGALTRPYAKTFASSK